MTTSSVKIAKTLFRNRSVCDNTSYVTPSPPPRVGSGSRRAAGRSRVDRLELDGQAVGGVVDDGRADERGEQRVRPGRAALELRVGLGGDEKRVLLPVQLDELDETPVRRRAGDQQPGGGHRLAVGVVHL